jgi:hypothetical protein
VSSQGTYTVNLASGRRWRLPDLPVAVHDAAGADLGGRVLVLGGGNATEQSAVQELGTARHRWRMAGRLPRRRSDLVAIAMGGTVLVMGGYDGTRSPTGVLSTSTGHAFDVAGRLAVPVRYPAVAVVRGRVWLFGGERDGKMIDAIQSLDPRTGRTQVVARLPHPLGHSTAFRIGRRVLVAGGRPGPDSVASALWWFDPSSLRLRRAGRLPYPVADAGAAIDGRVAYLLGGETPSLTQRVVRIEAVPRR